jgi:hypothetical protein
MDEKETRHTNKTSPRTKEKANALRLSISFLIPSASRAFGGGHPRAGNLLQQTHRTQVIDTFFFFHHLAEGQREKKVVDKLIATSPFRPLFASGGRNRQPIKTSLSLAFASRLDIFFFFFF